MFAWIVLVALVAWAVSYSYPALATAAWIAAGVETIGLFLRTRATT
jgi:hypothetical protein